jgi:hypothetical protein
MIPFGLLSKRSRFWRDHRRLFVKTARLSQLLTIFAVSWAYPLKRITEYILPQQAKHRAQSGTRNATLA